MGKHVLYIFDWYRKKRTIPYRHIAIRMKWYKCKKEKKVQINKKAKKKKDRTQIDSVKLCIFFPIWVYILFTYLKKMCLNGAVFKIKQIVDLFSVCVYVCDLSMTALNTAYTLSIALDYVKSCIHLCKFYLIRSKRNTRTRSQSFRGSSSMLI